ncbi:MAG: hypothetical protein UX02_C0002G0365 [Candidatus Moranbacteria bacterium GW2011_GWC1_45_18]|nr:MAG: hypothetical protein UT79_C0001G0096 [Candidatus Moranbacteria bacterium GW2011_GWC2_40_12]KKT34052.1 MAG: hypothetical protein UW19_C0002G0025 [Candidatus Moranbacteria bacterium GW2011_GWF2_44_10]KKT70216.1 MAG: hypothetical protein UW66_C0048G0003 [Candidatus Moranbacteria bacterium GW2011_GWF1_44_4]KKU00122.1 MAG: hypothetical protein UX02_C0002G0365 [Candidatus Moranbacteria bacterium GW2011_GWC1_45_18]OGI34797.1 MAG: hypothetical protein A2407_01180 [Candidatus Moranbacteria bacte
MANFIEKIFGGKMIAEEASTIKDSTFDELCNSLPEDLRKELCELAKEVSGEAGPPTKYFEGNNDDLSPKQRRFNELLSQAKHAHSESGERM